MHFFLLVVDVQYLFENQQRDGFKRTHTFTFVSRFVVSYSAGCHGGAVKVQPDLATAECTLQCVSYYKMCLINMAGHIFTTRKNLPL